MRFFFACNQIRYTDLELLLGLQDLFIDVLRVLMLKRVGSVIFTKYLRFFISPSGVDRLFAGA